MAKAISKEKVSKKAAKEPVAAKVVPIKAKKGVKEVAPSKAKAKNQSPMTFVCSIRTNSPFVPVNGTITEVTDDTLTIAHKKHRSKKMLQSVIPLSQVLMYKNPLVDGEGQVLVRRGQVEVDEIEGVTVSSEGHFVKVTAEDGTVFFIDNDAVDVVAEDDEATQMLTAKRKAEAEKADAKKAEAKKPAKAAKPAKAQVVEDEEEDEEDDEEEDEEDDDFDAEDDEEEEEDEEEDDD